jgi:hypothetical protein
MIEVLTGTPSDITLQHMAHASADARRYLNLSERDDVVIREIPGMWKGRVIHDHFRPTQIGFVVVYRVLIA